MQTVTRSKHDKERTVSLTSLQSSEIASRLDSFDRDIQNQIRAAGPQTERESFSDLAGTVYDAGDESVATMIEELSHTHMERYARELRQIQRARQRLADGEINECCTDCGDDIGYQRLRAYPIATRCIHCQTQHERTFGSHVVAQA
jgi:RNA polymerase-binding transcription factor DksA